MIATICDLTLAAESAIFGQVGPRVGSVDPGFGTAYLARIVKSTDCFPLQSGGMLGQVARSLLRSSPAPL